MRVMIVGGAGMLGHKVWQTLRDRFETFVTVHGSASAYPSGLFDTARVIERVDARDTDSIAAAFAAARPDVVVNCVGIVKQRAESKDPIASLIVNALFPHRLATMAAASGARVIHISTDCVFSGRTGLYCEDDAPDAADLYGRSKLLGELAAPHLTLRTSLIGRELVGSSGLVEWFLSRRGNAVEGYKTAIFSGVTTAQMARILVATIERGWALSGLYHVAAAPISKLDLLRLLNDSFHAGIEITCSDTLRVDRSLDGKRFDAAIGFAAPSWGAMIEELSADPTPYETWRPRDLR